MKNFYLFLAGIAFLASGTQLINNLSDDPSTSKEWVAEKAKKQNTVAAKTRKIPYSPLKKNKQINREFLVPGITATNTYALTNDTGLSGASAGDELEYTVTITNGGTAANGVVFTDQIDANTTLVNGSVKVSPIAQNDSYSAIGNVGLTITPAGGVLSNDISPAGTVLNIAGPASIPTAQGGTVAMDLMTGAFTYQPAAGFIGADTFTYTLQNGSGLTSQATVTINSAGAIWFINSAASAAGANGTLAKPFTSIANFQAINDGGTLHPKAGHSIFIYSGNYSGPVTLLGQQKLIGQGAGATLSVISGYSVPAGSNTLPITGGTRPELASSGGANAINVNANNTVRGLNVGGTAGAKIFGSTAGTLTINEVGLSGNGRALDLSNVTFAAEFSEVSSTVTSGISPVKISNSSGSLKINSGSISATNTSAIDISGNSLGLNVTLSFVSSSNTAKGIKISGTTGTFQVTGNGTDLGSGGIIQSISGRGIELINAAGITLKYMNLIDANTAEGSVPSSLDNTNSNAAVHANNVAGLTLDRVIISGTVVQEGVNLRTVSNFNFTNGSIGKSGSQTQSEEGCIYAINTSGTNSITNSTFDDPGGRAAYFSNTNTNMDLLTVDNSTFKNADNGPGIQVEGLGNSNMKLKIQNGSKFLDCRTSGIEVYANNTSQIQADIKNSTINVGAGVGTGIDISASGTATAKFNVLNNTSNYRNGPCLNFFSFENGYLEGNVTGNTLTKSALGGSGIFVHSEGTTARGVVKIENNTINNQSSGSGINIMGNVTGGAQSDFTINNNTVNLVNDGSLYGIDFNAVGAAGNTAQMCGNLTNNKITLATGSLNAARIRSGQPGGTVVLIQGTGGTVQDVWNNGGNTPVNRASQSGTGTFTFGQTCAVPNVSPLRIAAEDLVEENIIADQDSSVVKEQTEEVVAESTPIIEETPEITTNPAREETTLAGETVIVNGTGSGFTIPDGKNVVIKFKVTINNVPTSVCQVSNQGTVTGSNFSSVLTDDPGVAGTNNPTVTPLIVPEPGITQSPAAQSICVGTGTSFTVATSATGVTYQWQKKPSGGVFANITLAENPTANSATLSLTNVPVSDNQSEYRSIVSNGCAISTSQAALLTASVKPTIALSGDEYLCNSGLSSYTVYFTASAGAVVTSDKGTVSGNTVTGIPSGETAIITATAGGCATILTAFKNCALPVTLIDFSALNQENSVMLRWKTSAETNSEKFDIERSMDGKNWQNIGSQRSKGESSAIIAYSFLDKEPANGNNFYRLKMVDLDQTYAYSRIVNVNMIIQLKSEIYPNPVSDLLFIKSSDWSKVSAVELYDIQGRKVYESRNNLTKTVQVKDLPVGMYVLAIVHKNGVISNQKVLINR